MPSLKNYQKKVFLCFINILYNSLCISDIHILTNIDTFFLEQHCAIIWTSGFTFNIGSTNMSDWKWIITPEYSKPITYSTWGYGEPDNIYSSGEQVLIYSSFASSKWKWVDYLPRQGDSSWKYCYVCECSLYYF